MLKRYGYIVFVLLLLFSVGLVQRAYFDKFSNDDSDRVVLVSILLVLLFASLFSLEYYRKIENDFFRFLTLLLFCSLVTAVGFLFTKEGTEYFSLLKIGIAFTIAFSVAERMELLRYRSEELRRLFVKKEQIERALLTQQLNPHFLFNTLNTLKGLIEEDQDKAVDYLHDFAKVYRFIVNIEFGELFRLEEELNLLSSYYRLLKSRFGDKLILELNVSEAHLSTYLPPLSLQLLFENAIKHNEVSAARPLTVRITSVGSKLFITNPIQEKVSFDASNGLGLSNLNLRYMHAIGVEISYSITDKNEFQVTLPLFEKEKGNA